MSIIKNIDHALAGAPNQTLSLILFLIAIIAGIIAVFGSPSIKVIAATWFIAP